MRSRGCMRSSEVYEVKFGIEGQVRRSGGKERYRRSS